MKTVECEKCNGTGLVAIGSGVRGLEYCKYCHGLGKHDVKEPTAWDSVKLNRFDDAEMTTVSIPANQIITNEMINEGINNVLGTSKLLEELNELVIKDANERYVRELLNRIHKAVDELSKGVEFCKNDSQGLYDKCNIAINRERRVIDILMGVDEESNENAERSR